ncbi:hypothetical protein Poli38472_009046 [Pythium oligandrum]|uniref:Succinylglutamate desuccinylase/Aspartoacylase catalytic domain-containing protein n=1 Tax=Pythium oligandrum TaxID=41045 RepID=A0A8K1CKS3_PYTOL|nr:hypothetical protein Poli38472_009046 [Pythium oligandrum]|eukprot:TMW64879.1 hypothetical protein Poli38472_009046 [Pythium oligandrum]
MTRAYNSFTRLAHGILEFRRPGAGTGPRVTVVGGVHGNERIGVRVLDALRLALLQLTPSPLTTSTTLAPGAVVTLVYANEQALRIGKRGSTPHADLNRCFTTEILTASSSSSTYEENRARELAAIFAKTDVLVDLHSTNKPSEPFIRIAGHAHGLSTDMQRLAARLPCQILLRDPRFLLADGRVALTDEYVGSCGGLGICYESGVATDLSTEKVESITQSLWTMLVEDMRAIESPEMSTTDNSSVRHFEHVYEITQVFKLTERGFRWADGVGTTNFQCVPAGKPIGFVGENEPFVVNYDAHIVFPKVPELWKIGAPLGWLTKKISS